MKIKLKKGARLFPGSRFPNLDLKKWKSLRSGGEAEVDTVKDFISGDLNLSLSRLAREEDAQKFFEGQGFTIKSYDKDTHTFVATRNEWKMVKDLFEEVKFSKPTDKGGEKE